MKKDKPTGNIIYCEFVSVWSDESEIITPAEYNKKTGEVTVTATSNADPNGSLEREYIVFPDGDEKEVCTTCHGYTMKSEMNPGVGHDLNEEQVCSNPDCESRF